MCTDQMQTKVMLIVHHNPFHFSTTQSGLTLDTLAIVDGSSSNTDAFDEFEGTISATLFGSDISVGYADDVNSDISYYGVQVQQQSLDQ